MHEVSGKGIDLSRCSLDECDLARENQRPRPERVISCAEATTSAARLYLNQMLEVGVLLWVQQHLFIYEEHKAGSALCKAVLGTQHLRIYEEHKAGSALCKGG